MTALSVRNMFRSLLMLTSIAAFAAGLACCGGGGGGGGEGMADENLYPGDLTLSATPDTIDAGDRMQVQSELSNVYSKGIVLKYRFPAGLKYVQNSARLNVANLVGAIVPAFEVSGTVEPSPTSSPSSTNSSPTPTPSGTRVNYLVFIFGENDFAGRAEGIVSFLLEGVSRVEDGSLGVDADLNDPTLPDSKKFNVNKPKYEPQEEISINVKS